VSALTTHVTGIAPSGMTAERFAAADTFDAFLAAAVESGDLWRTTARRAALPPDLTARAAAITAPRRLVMLHADWCVDAINTMPYVARLVEAMPDAELRSLDRDANLDLMDAHLTGTARAIPIVLVYDDAFRELGWWGPRPAELQGWVKGPGQALDKEARYKEARTWYVRDRGRSTVLELLTLLEPAAD
jgi:hypothetical protein